jgi:TRAP-type mannitol/chloroaromatic compound transport system permease small subunit
MQVLAGFTRLVSGINWLVGQVLSWLALGCVLVCFTVVVQRYAFNTSTLWMQDLYVWLGVAMFTGVAGFALMRNDHVRVDVLPARPGPLESHGRSHRRVPVPPALRLRGLDLWLSGGGPVLGLS